MLVVFVLHLTRNSFVTRIFLKLKVLHIRFKQMFKAEIHIANSLSA